MFLDITLENKRKDGSDNQTKECEKIQLETLQSFVKSISHGEIPEPITDNNNDSLNEIKKDINTCIEGLQGLVECNKILQRLAVNDHTKGVEGKYTGIYASMSEATNGVRERLNSITGLVSDMSVGSTSQLEEIQENCPAE